MKHIDAENLTHFGSDVIVGSRDTNANGVKLSGAVAGSGATVEAVGDDTNIALTVKGKGSGAVTVGSSTSPVLNPYGNGAKNGATVTATEYGSGQVHQTLLTCAATPITLKDSTAPAQGGGVKLYDFPEGRILVLGTTGTMSFTTTSALASTLNASVTLAWGCGSILYNNTAGNGTLTSTEVDMLPSTAATSSATINVANTATRGALAASAQFDGTTTAKDLYLNVSVPTATDIDGDATLTAAGTIRVTWINLGDY